MQTDAATKNSKTRLAIIISVVVAAFAATLFTLGVYIWKKKPTDKRKGKLLPNKSLSILNHEEERLNSQLA